MEVSEKQWKFWSAISRCSFKLEQGVKTRWKWTYAFAVLGCPEVSAPGTLTSGTFLCKSGSVFPDSKERKRTLECRNGKWNETATKLPDCIGKNSPVRFITLRSALFLFLRIIFYIFYLYIFHYQLFCYIRARAPIHVLL